MLPCLIGIFLFLCLGFGLLLGLDELFRERKEKQLQRRRYKQKGGLGSRTQRLLDRSRTLIRGSGFPLPVYFLMTLGCGVGGFLAGKIIYSSPLIAGATGVTMLFAPLLLFSFRETKAHSRDLGRLASSMMILSNSYVVTEDFLTTVRDNLDILEYPEPFRDFYAYSSLLDSDIRGALRRMERQVPNGYFSQWVDALVLAQDDRQLKYVTVSVVRCFYDALQVQQESEAAMFAVWRDYFLVLILIFSVPLVFRFLLAEAYATMTTSLLGQGMLLLLLGAVVFSVLRALKLNRPVTA